MQVRLSRSACEQLAGQGQASISRDLRPDSSSKKTPCISNFRCLQNIYICREHAKSSEVREKVLVFIGGGHLGGEDVGMEFRGAEIHIHPVRMKEVFKLSVFFDCF